jgi:DNA-binding MarR family transcriptional regulator
MNNSSATVTGAKRTNSFLESEAPETQTFVISQINNLNVLLKRRAAVYARRTFGFTLTEWRIITLLRTLPPVSIRALSVKALAATALTSRSVSSLVSKGFVSRKKSAEDNREFLVSLTKRGRELSVEMYHASLRRNDELLAGYERARVKDLVETLSDLISRAHLLVAQDEDNEVAAGE